MAGMTDTSGNLKIALASGGTISGDQTFTGSVTINGDLTFGDAAVDSFTINGDVTYATGAAITAASYQVQRDADATNQLHFNVPTGATFEWSVNDTAEMALSATNLQPGTNDGNALGVSGTAWSDLFLASGAVIDFAAGTLAITHSLNTLTFTGGRYIFTGATYAGGSSTTITATGGANSAVSAATECNGISLNFSATKTWAAGAGPLANQREIYIQAPTYVGAAGGALTITDAYSFYINGAPTQGANMTLTRTWAAGFNGNIGVGAGTVALPSLTFLGDPDTGFYNEADTIYTTLGGVLAKTINTTAGTTHVYRNSEKQGADVASASTIALGTGGNVFEITGVTAINLITSTNWQNGSKITLIANENVTVNHGTATSGGDITILLAGAGNFAMTANDTLTLVLSETTASGQAWREVARAVI